MTEDEEHEARSWTKQDQLALEREATERWMHWELEQWDKEHPEFKYNHSWR